jgi:hypothetical protein
MESSKEVAPFKFDCYDTFEWYVSLGPLSNIDDRYLKGKIPTWNNFVDHPNYDEFWQRQAAAQYLTRATVPTLVVGGWWDQEDLYGALKVYEELAKHDTNHLTYLVMGPWYHGGWNFEEGNTLGPLEFGGPTAVHFRGKVQSPFFSFFLKGEGTFALPSVLTFQAGSNTWVSDAAWPPRTDVKRVPLYLREDSKLSLDPPKELLDGGFDRYVSDPARPVPNRPRPMDSTFLAPNWRVWLVQDQRLAHLRPDVLSWETEPLTEDVTLSGDVNAHLFASTSGTDSDWIVKLIDVYPEEYAKDPKMGGYQLMVANEVFRGRFLKSFERPEALTPDKVERYVIDMHSTNYRFLKGHKIMVQVQSTWFPVIDRNPQTFVPSIFKAKASDFKPAVQRVFRTPEHPSHLVLSVRGE